MRLRVLETLENCDGYALPESSLRSHVDALTRPPVQDDEWQACIDWLDGREMIRAVPSPLDDELQQWTLTERGRVLLLAK